MSVCVAPTIFINATSPPLASAAWSSWSAALNGWRRAQSGWRGAMLLTRSSANSIWKYMGCSLHSVPSLSNTAMRSSAATKSGPPERVTARTNSTMAVRDGPSFQDGSSSTDAACWRGAAQAASSRAMAAAPRRAAQRRQPSVVCLSIVSSLGARRARG